MEEDIRLAVEVYQLYPDIEETELDEIIELECWPYQFGDILILHRRVGDIITQLEAQNHSNALPWGRSFVELLSSSMLSHTNLSTTNIKAVVSEMQSNLDNWQEDPQSTESDARFSDIEFLQQPVARDLRKQYRTVNRTFEFYGIDCIGDLLQHTKRSLGKMRGIGPKRLEDIRNALETEYKIFGPIPLNIRLQIGKIMRDLKSQDQ